MKNIDLKLDNGGDLEISPTGDITATNSICQAVRIRLLWFFQEWRLGPEAGFPYFEEVFVKTPNETKIRHLVREEAMKVDGVRDVRDITIEHDRYSRMATICFTLCTDEEMYEEEVKIEWHSMD